MAFTHTVGVRRHVFADLRTLLAKASPARSGDAWRASPPPARKSGWRRVWRWRTCRWRIALRSR
jgi:hypothetical protein